MYSVLEKFKKLSRDLYPKGAAFRSSPSGEREKLHTAIARSYERLYSRSLSVLDSAIADNPSFTEDDAADWERRLGILRNISASLEERMDVINEKLNYPGTDEPRQHHKYIEGELRAAGFDVYIYENNFNGQAVGPKAIISPSSPDGALHGQATLHGASTRHGTAFVYNNLIANYVEEERDRNFIVAPGFRGTFFVSSDVLDVFAEVPLTRKNEFRHLLLKLKPAHTVGYLFVNYV